MDDEKLYAIAVTEGGVERYWDGVEWVNIDICNRYASEEDAQKFLEQARAECLDPIRVGELAEAKIVCIDDVYQGIVNEVVSKVFQETALF